MPAKRRQYASARAPFFESLEARCLFAGDASVEPAAAFVVTEADLLPGEQQVAAVMTSIPEGLRQKITYSFWFSLRELEGAATSALVSSRPGADLGLPPSPSSRLSEMTFQYAHFAQVTDDGKVLLQLTMTDMSDAAIARLTEIGVEVRSTIAAYHRVKGWISIFNIRALGDVDEVGKIGLPLPGFNRPLPSPDLDAQPAANIRSGIAEDVNGDGMVTPLDANLAIMSLNAHGPRYRSEVVDGADTFIDVSGDDAMTALDVLLIINYLNAHSNPGGEQPHEPSSVTAEAVDDISRTWAVPWDPFVLDFDSPAAKKELH